MERIRIQPASIAQVHRSLRSGTRTLVREDVQQIAQDLHEIRATLKLEHDPLEDIWVVLEEVTDRKGDRKDKLVTTWDVAENGPVDQRLVQHVRKLASPGYDLLAELDKADRQGERDRAHRFREQVGPIAERLQHALLKDLGLKSDRVLMGKGLPDA